MDHHEQSSNNDLEASVQRPLSPEIPPMMSFCLQLKPLWQLKEVISALCDPNLNPQGIAMIEVGRGEIKLRLTAYNESSETTAFLDVNAFCDSLTDFYCSKPMENKFVNLYDFLRILQHRHDFSPDTTIDIFHVDGTSKLSLFLGDDPYSVFDVDIPKESSYTFERPPDKIVYCGGATLFTNDLKRIIPFMFTDEGQSRAIRVEITDKLVSISIGSRIWELEFAIPGEINGMSEGQRHCVWIHWPHVQVLEKLCEVVTTFYMAVVTDPPNHIIFQFGRLIFFKKSSGWTLLNFDTLN